MFICGQHFDKAKISKIQSTIDTEPTISRYRLSRRICEWLNWKSPNGKPRDMSCRKAISKLHSLGHICLSRPQSNPPFISHRVPKHTSEIKDIPTPVSCTLKELGSIDIVMIGSCQSKNSRIWNELMKRYHYLGSGPLCGAQIRYLIKHKHYGWLGGLSFSAGAWRVKVRDCWIGWSDAARRQNLPLVIANSRFLIAPYVSVPHLASHVLSRCIRRLPQDWHQRYGYSPVLIETFVERDRFRGTCYRAANWQYIGTTQGRGRQDCNHDNALTIKDIYLYPLCTNARQLLSQAPTVHQEPPPQSHRSPEDWVEEEFGNADLGDGRLNKRLLNITRDFYARPQASIPQACQSRARTKAVYRFLEHPHTSIDKIFQSHYESTLNRVRKEKIVLAVQDTTHLNYTAHPATENLGPLSFIAKGHIGLHVHDTLAFSVEGTPLGLLDVQCWARDPKQFGKKKRRNQLPIEQKESYKWLKSYQKVIAAQKRCSDTLLVSVGDREADVYELFDSALSNPSHPRVLIRAIQNRALENEQCHLWEKLIQQPISGIQEIKIPRKKNRKARIARLAVRFSRVTLKPPQLKPHLKPLTVWAVYAREEDAPADVEPLEWMLLTTLEVSSFAQAIEKLSWYSIRWGIEVYHRTLKSGCKIEERQLGNAERIESCLAIDMVIAWRIMHLTKLGRETPDVPCTVFFEQEQWKALVAYITRNPVTPKQPPTLREATRMVASLGGFLGRKGDGEPGTKSLWLGLQRLDDLTEMWKVIIDIYAPHLRKHIVSSDPGYG